MTPKKESEELYLIAKDDCESCEGLAGLGIGERVCCFLAQQAVEKCMKAVLFEKAGQFPFTHNLITLYELLSVYFPKLPFSKDELDVLNPFAVIIRYGFFDDDYPESKDVLAIATKAVSWCHGVLYAH